MTTPDGTPINYDIPGARQAPALLLLSGTGHDGTFRNGQIPLLSGTFRCIAVDNRGTGKSDKPARA